VPSLKNTTMGTTRTDLYAPQDLELASWAKALGHPARIAILRHLVACETCITGDLTEVVGLAQATVSQHLRELKELGLIRGTVQGTAVNYCIDPDQWQRASGLLGAFFDHGPLLKDACCPAPDAPNATRESVFLNPNSNPTSPSTASASVSPVRWDVLEPIAHFLAEQIRTRGGADVQFICTHNSRRSQMAHAWGHVYAAELDLPIRLFSGGTEATACHPHTVDALVRAGFSLVNAAPVVLQGPHGGPVTLTSKRFDDPLNASDGFLALMTCSDADENCPFIPQARARMPLRYSDPKDFDGTEQEHAAYYATCSAISHELKALFERVVELL
jgi:arsenate reductase